MFYLLTYVLTYEFFYCCVLKLNFELQRWLSDQDCILLLQIIKIHFGISSISCNPQLRECYVSSFLVQILRQDVQRYM